MSLVAGRTEANTTGAARCWSVRGAALLAGILLQSHGAGAVEFGHAVVGSTVPDRPQPLYDPIGIRAGSFMVYPSLGVRAIYNDNIYAEPTDRKSDAIIAVQPAVYAKSLWERHSLTARLSGDIGIFTQHSSEDYQDARANLQGRIDIAEGSSLKIGLEGGRDHERRDSPDDARGLHPTIFYRLAPNIQWDQRFNRLSLRLTGDMEKLDFRDVQALNGAIINEDDRDRLSWDVEGRVGYDFVKSVEGFASALYDNRNYVSAVDDRGFDRDSHGYGIFGGIILEVTGTMSAEAYAGYRRQDYKDPRLKSFGGFGGGLNLVWAPTKLTTVTVTGERVIEETTQKLESGVFASRLSVTVDHELRRNVIITLSGRFIRRDYQGQSRTDETWQGSAGVEYKLSRHFRLRAGYTYNSRDSTAASENFEMNQAYVDLHADY
ncbi:MAG: outer membrane beta-barrel protein [Alphaproteobacteria bacterium]|nr:outer membrane beta-barrel protein [Alphaproteobacteria bacterium]